MLINLPIASHARRLWLAASAATCLISAGCAAPLTLSNAETANTGPSAAKFAYVANVLDSTISMYTVSAAGLWIPTSPATVATGP